MKDEEKNKAEEAERKRQEELAAWARKFEGKVPYPGGDDSPGWMKYGKDGV